jgi:predicted metal-binding protein
MTPAHILHMAFGRCPDCHEAVREDMHAVERPYRLVCGRCCAVCSGRVSAVESETLLPSNVHHTEITS